MRKYLTKRLVQCIAVLFAVSFLVFFFIHLSPGDPVRLVLGTNYDPAVAETLRHQLGLDRPFLVQYFSWLGRMVSGDMGRSYYSQEPVWSLIASRVPYTAMLAGFGVLIAIIVAVPLGVVAAVKRDTLVDHVARVVSILGISMPIFWIGLLFLYLFCLKLGWLPPTGSVREYGLKSLLLPSMALGLSTAALVTRMTRSSLLEVLGREYVRTARSKGLPERAVLYRHALRNAMLPVLTVIGMEFGSLLGGAVVTETVFSVPGLGRLLVESIFRRDYPLIQGCVLVVTAFFVIINFLVDTLYAVIDPRIGLS